MQMYYTCIDLKGLPKMNKPKTKLSDSAWMPHDLDCIADRKFFPLVSKFKALGYAIFWRVNELLHQEPGHRLELNETLIDGICTLFGCEPEHVQQIIAYAIKCDLYTRDGNYFYSERVLRNVERKTEIAESRKVAAKTRWDKSKQKQSNSNANAMQDYADKKRVEEIYPKRVYISDTTSLPDSTAIPSPQPLEGLVAGWPYKSPGEKLQAEQLLANIDLKDRHRVTMMLDELEENIPAKDGIISFLEYHQSVKP